MLIEYILTNVCIHVAKMTKRPGKEPGFDLRFRMSISYAPCGGVIGHHSVMNWN